MNKILNKFFLSPFTQKAGIAIAGLTAATLIISGCGKSDPDNLLREAANSAAAGQWKKAIDQAEKAVAGDRNNPNAKVMLGIAHYVRRNLEKAEDVLSRAAKAAPENFSAQYFYGLVLYEQENYAKALNPLRKAFQLRKDNPDLLILLSRCCIQQNLKEGTRYLQVLRRFRNYGKEPEVYNSIALIWLGHRNYDMAEKYLLEAKDKKPRNPVVLQNLAVFYDRYRQNIKKALKYYRRCLQASMRVDDNERANKVRNRLRELAKERI